MKKLTGLLILAMAFSIVSISFSRRGPVEGRWDNRDTDEERKWSNQSDPNFYVYISRSGEDSDGPAYSKSSASASPHLIYAWTGLGAEGSDDHDIWEYWGNASLDHDWVTTTPGDNPDAYGGDSNGDFGQIEFHVYLTEFGHLAPADTISDCKANGSVWSDPQYVDNNRTHSSSSRTKDDHSDVYINGELQ